jgi:hypothetical protein
MRVAAVLVFAAAMLCSSTALAAGSGPDGRATHAYLTARYRLLTALLHDAPTARAAERAAASHIARECAGVVSGMPKEPRPFEAPSLRIRGEDDRLRKQKQTIEEELTAAVADSVDSLYRPAEEAYAGEVGRLSWSNPAIASTLGVATKARLETVAASAPPFCADAKAWVQSGYRDLSASSREFEAARAARRNGDERQESSLEKLLKPYESAADRALIRRTEAGAIKLLVGIFASLRTVSRLERTVGFPAAIPKEPKQVALGRGRTAAGTRFEVSAGSGGLFGVGSCRRSASVSYSRPGVPEVLIMGGPNNPICLSPPRFRRPALFCEAGIETIQTAVPASVRSARLVLADGRTIESHVIRVSRRHGGPAGIYAQELRGNASHAVSLVELSSGGAVVLTLKLRSYHCVKSSSQQPEFPPKVRQVATGRTPEGEPFTISTFGGFNGEPFLNVDIGVDPELDEPSIGPGARKAFNWSLSLGCAPHPYAILYGILAPPGGSVVAQTQQGTVPLNVVPFPSSMHAKGPLVYGVFSALPSELTVLGANGSTVYAESLQAKAAEAAQFCEGYAEP